MEHWEWPQWVYAGLFAFSVLMNLGLHGEPRTGKYNGGVGLFSVGLASWILYCGGFWS